MASYLPVLLYSVGSNAAPDDSALTTLPRGQVDYLSHDWQEEDVWRSWRNMTRQKNEIANGMRLENASWRTWWKQRNNLKTVSPETLNWLKDSDVTWLYGPLHTAVEWTPPPKPKPDETEHKMASARDRLDLSEPKSILKYRSISEMLTSDLPSPLFSPAESDNESNGETSDADAANPRRPALSHTKSDTHITRWGPNRNFRKDSPPRVEPSGGTNAGPSNDDAPHHVYSATNLSGYFASHIQGQNQYLSPQVQGEHSSSSSPSPKDDSSETTPSGGIHTNGHKRKHITFNTFVEQCIAIDKPKSKETSFAAFASEDEGDWYIKSDPGRTGYDDGYDEDGEDGFDGDWGLDECAIGTDSESDVDQEAALLRGEGEIEEDDDEDDEGIIQMKPRRDSFNSQNNARCLRSTSKVSSSSSSSSSNDYSSSSTSAPSSSYSSSSNRKTLPANIRRRKRSDGPNHISLPRKGSLSTLIHNNPSTAPNLLDKEMVSIAPIPPTILKTGGNTSWDGFGIHSVQSPYHHSASSAWAEGFGDEGLSDDGGNMRAGPGGAHLYFGHHSSDSEGSTPVGLVYMPPATSRYGGSRLPRVGSNTSLDSEAEVELREDANQKDADDVLRSDKKMQEKAENREHPEAYFSIDSDKGGVLGSRSVSVPIVVRTPAVGLARGDVDDDDGAEEDAWPDLGEDFAQQKTESSARRKPLGTSDNGSSQTLAKGEDKPQAADEERKSRSRSRSRSRTPSPSYVAQSSTPAISVTGQVEQNVSPLSSSSLLSPPQRGRGSIPSDPSSSRGRSSKTSSSFSDRERSRSNHSSPIGSLSPEGMGSAYSAHGRGGGDRERERERSNRSGGRGRERTERRLSHSLSPDAVESVTSLGQDAASPVSSSSVSRTIIPPTANGTSDHSISPVDIPADDDSARSQTPANSPIISMSGAAHAIARLNGKAPIHISDPQVSSPRLSYSDPSNVTASLPSSSPSMSNPSDSSTSSSIPAGDAGVVGKAVDMVSSAGAYLGLWNNGTVS